MAKAQLVGRRHPASVKSRLGVSLVRLHHSLKQTRRDRDHVENLFDEWQKKWSTQRNRISRQLATIESQLQELSGTADTATRLTVVGAEEEHVKENR